jgi:hypothetical protein
LIEASGSRTNYAEVVNQLAEKVLAALKIDARPATWNTADEADKFFKEAQWDLSWGLLPQAQAAVESAWALGKQDEDCATVRIHSYQADITRNFPNYHHSQHYFSAPRNFDGKIIGPGFSNEYVQRDINEMVSTHKFGIAFKKSTNGSDKTVQYDYASDPPNEENLNRARHTLQLYLDSSRALFPVGGQAYAELQRSGWYKLGIETLTDASEILKAFNLSTTTHPSDPNNISELRTLTRMVAGWLADSPGVRAGYFVNQRIATHDKLFYTTEEVPDIFKCQVNWGCFWQEKPEDTMVLYRRLLGSPAFCYLHEDLWYRDLLQPRLVAWNETDQKRLPEVWNSFLNELLLSTNVLWQMEARALRLADTKAQDERELTDAFTNFFDAFVENRAVFKTNNVNVLYFNWSVGKLVEHLGGGSVTPTTEALQARFKTEYSAKLAAKDEELGKQLAARDEELRAENSKTEKLQAFEKQKAFLKAGQPFNPSIFVDMFIFGFKDYSREQALEIKPLLAEYEKGLSGTWARNGEMQVEQVEANVEHIINPAAATPWPSHKWVARTKPLNQSENQAAFEKQKAFLKAKAPHDPHTFFIMFLFGFRDYSRAQALEIKPLLAEYKKGLTGTLARIGEMQVGEVEANVEHIINPAAATPTPSPAQAARTDGSSFHPSNPAAQTGRLPWLQPAESASPGRPGFSPNRHTEPATASNAPVPDPLVSSNIITVKDFYPCLLEGIPGYGPHAFRFTGHRLIEGKLLFDFRYNAIVYSFDKNGNWQSSTGKIFVGMAVFDPDTRRWIVAMLPDPFSFIETVNFTSQQSFLWRGNLYSSYAGKIQKYDSQKQAWQPTGFAVEGGQFYNLDGQLYRTDYNSIQEITENGHATKLLASIQRQPPVSSLDSQGALINLALFVDAQKNLCAAVHHKIFRWDGHDWHEIAAAATSFTPAVFDEGVIFPTDGYNLRPARISGFNTRGNVVELYLVQTGPEAGHRGYVPPTAIAGDLPKPLWELPAELSLPNFSATLWQSDLYVMADHSEQKEIENEQKHLIVGTEFHPRDGYNASLFCFSRDLPAAHQVRLKFEASDGCPPTAGTEYKSGFAIPGAVGNQVWMQFTTNLLLCGCYAAPDNFKPGIWVASLDPIVSEANALKQMQFKTRLQEKAKAEQIEKEAQAKDQQSRQAFLLKYDLNHNGIIDDDELDAAREDPYYLKFRLEQMRAQKRNEN